MKIRTTLLFLSINICSFGQDISGKWTTIDDETGVKKSVVEITVKDGIATGYVIDLYDTTKLGNTCTKCTDDRKDKPIVGLQIIRDMVLDDDEWEDGTILDPLTGKVYDCKLWVDDGKLQVRGYVAFFYRTQVWVR